MVTSDDCSREEKMFSSCLSTSFHVQQYGSIIDPFQVKIQTIPEQDGSVTIHVSQSDEHYMWDSYIGDAEERFSRTD